VGYTPRGSPEGGGGAGVAQFKYDATTSGGDLKSGVIDAATPLEAERMLREQGLRVTELKRKSRDLNIQIPGFGGVPVKSKVVFIRQLATMIDAGLPLVQCLDILGSQEPHPKLKKTIQGVRAQVEAGSSFADALARYPKEFDELFVSLVSAGELGGILDTILNRLAAYMEKAMKLRQKVKAAMKYPVTVLIISVGITMFLLVKVIPSFADMFKSMGKKLPALTETMIGLSKTTQENLPAILLVMSVIVVAWKLALRTTKGRWYWDMLILKLPIFGPLIKKAAVAKFTRTLGTLISSGVPILDALEIVAKTAGNKVIEASILYAREKISEGKSIAGPLMEKGIFPKMVVQMVAVGESTGAMDVMLSKIADFYEDEVDVAVDGITALIEPLIMVVLGGLIGSVLLAMYLPIFSMADSVSQ
jgi:type IV pilus assembly protein PilC